MLGYDPAALSFKERFMLQCIKDWFKFSSEKGLNFPFAYDSTTGKASVTLYFAYISFFVMMASVLALHFDLKLVTATIITIIIFVLCAVFYLMRRINSFKADLKNESIQLDNNEKGDEK